MDQIDADQIRPAEIGTDQVNDRLLVRFAPTIPDASPLLDKFQMLFACHGRQL
jgi:hypothetical protein